MRKLSTNKLKRWYRIKDHVVYDILTTKPTDKLINDYFYSEDVNLPYIELKYGFVDKNNNLTKHSVIEKLYLDSYIEVGDSYGDSFFTPYINNGEASDTALNYILIYEEEVKSDIYNFVINGLDKASILKNIPFYLKNITEENVYHLGKTSIMKDENNNLQNVNCIYEVSVKNCGIGSAEITNFEENYDNIIIDVINNYCRKIASNLATKQEISNITINNTVVKATRPPIEFE